MCIRDSARIALTDAEGTMLKTFSKTAWRWLVLGMVCACVVYAQVSPGYNTRVPSTIMEQFRNQRVNWAANVWVYANTLFGMLAIIEFAWSAAVMKLEKSDLQSW